MGLAILWKGITLGLGAAAPIGPVNVEIARRAIRGGFVAGFLLGLGAVSVDVTYVVLASFSVRLFLDRPRIMLGMGVAGGGVFMVVGGGGFGGGGEEGGGVLLPKFGGGGRVGGIFRRPGPWPWGGGDNTGEHSRA